MEHILPQLVGVAPKWKSLGEALSLDEDILDEIYTNNETDEDCLRDMLERYLLQLRVSQTTQDLHVVYTTGSLH